MKKLSLMAALLAIAWSLPSVAAESAAGGVEFSGNVDIVTGWQHDDSDAIGDLSGQLGDFRGPTSPNRDTFNFYIDQVELDINKSFGEKIRLRADLDFGRVLSGSTRITESPPNVPTFPDNFMIEQAYVTLGLLGGEFLIGRFNVPIGYYLVDRADNPTLSFSNIYNFVTPTNATGAKLYWAFTDNIDLHLYAVNQLYDCTILGTPCLVGPFPLGDSAVPSWGLRLGFTWGAEENKSAAGLAYAGGPEQPGTNGSLTHMVVLDFGIKATENLLIAGEGIYYRQAAGPTVAVDATFAGGDLILDYALSDTWDIFFSYGYMNDFQGLRTGAAQQIHNFLIGAGYQITEGAKVKLEYRADLHVYNPTMGLDAILPAGGTPGVTVLADTSSLSHGLAAEFAYRF